MEKPESGPRWEHFPHGADIGVRGFGLTKSQAFEQAALALTAVLTDPAKVTEKSESRFICEAPDDELLFVDWLNALVYAMSWEKMVFCRFKVVLNDHHLQGTAWGEKVDQRKHEPAVEVKGATYTELRVRPVENEGWVAQCVVDV
jgi:tRNA nucleotidyltransferase (CCA-adding enzyme)